MDKWIERIVMVLLFVLFLLGAAACFNYLESSAREECDRKGGTFIVSDGIRGKSYTCFPKGVVVGDG